MQNDPLAGWRLVTELGLEDIAILLAGGDPGAMIADKDWHDHIDSPKRDRALPAVAGFLRALEADVRSGVLPARLAFQAHVSATMPNALVLVDRRQIEDMLSSDLFLPPKEWVSTAWADKLIVERPIDWANSRVRTEDLRIWLKAKGMSGTVFDTQTKEAADGLPSPAGPHFAPELDLALTAWRAVSGSSQIKGTVKQALNAWITENPGAWRGDEPLGTGALERITVVANWNQKGGPPRRS